MVNRQNSHFGSNGYKDLGLQDKAQSRSFEGLRGEKRKSDEKMIAELRDISRERMNTDNRASKFHMPVGVGGRRK